MSAEEWKAGLAFEDLPDAHKKLAEIIGIDAMMKLCEACGGMAMYIPMIEGVYTAARAKAIREEYNGKNVAKLARKYSLTARGVYKIVSGTEVKIDGQTSIFDSTA